MLDYINQKICNAIADAKVLVDSKDLIHFEAIVISDQFCDLRPLARQRLIYAALAPDLQNGKIHALSLKTFTQDEWNKKCES
jgi:acid stress-induced BolA-like protein IbaG/YrbA